MTDKKMTPEEFVKRWLPEYEKRKKEYYGEPKPRQEGFCSKCVKEPFDEAYFPEALEAFARHVWDQACREQRQRCAKSAYAYYDEDGCLEVDKDKIRNAPAPEFKITEK